MKQKILTLGMVTLLALPIGISAKDYRAEKPATWTAHSVDNAIKSLYGNNELIENNNIVLKVSKVHATGAYVPIKIKSTIDAKTVSLFQDINPESAVAVWSIVEGGIIDYSLKIKLKRGTINIIAVIEGKDGKLYSKHEAILVTGGGCE